MWYVTGIPALAGNILWQHGEGGAWEKEKGVKISFHLPSFSNQNQRRQAIKAIERILEKNNVSWINTGHKEWILDLDKLKEFIPNSSSMNWLKGKVSLEPEFEIEERMVFDKPKHEARVNLYVGPETLRRPVVPLEPPIEIKESFERFKHDYPNPAKVAFIMMQFGKTKAHNEIAEAIKGVLGSHGISGVKADDKQYHNALFYNIMTYLYGCGFGIAVFERIEAEKFNPNVSLEVGYMLALNKSVCLLKDKTLKTLHTDIIGKLYEAFDTQDPINTIPDKITKWLSDWKII